MEGLPVPDRSKIAERLAVVDRALGQTKQHGQHEARTGKDSHNTRTGKTHTTQEQLRLTQRKDS
jgi:hypothetical protein